MKRQFGILFVVLVSWPLAGIGQLVQCDTPGAVYLQYERESGALDVVVPDDADSLTTLEIRTSIDFFVGPAPAEFAGLFDIWSPTKVFRLLPSGFRGLSWPEGSVATRTTFENIVESVKGSFAQGGVPDFAYCQSAPQDPTVVVAPHDWQSDGVPTFIYDIKQGTLVLDNPLPPLTTIEIRSTRDFFVGDAPSEISKAKSDVWTPRKSFWIEPSGFQSFQWDATTVQTGVEDVWKYLSVKGAYLGGGALGQFDVVTVPEPAASAIELVLGTSLICWRIGRRRLDTRRDCDE